ncbi:EAL domain-containing protein [Luteibacter sp. PPL552]
MSGAFLAASLGALLTWLTVSAVANRTQSAAQARFDSEAAELKVNVMARLERPRYGLDALRGTVAALGEAPGVVQFRKAVAASDPRAELPGVLGFGFIADVPRDALPAFLDKARSEYGDSFALRTSGDAQDLYVIRSIEPLPANRAALGFDVGSEAQRRATLDRARTTGQLAVTPPIHLLQKADGSYGALYVADARATDIDGRVRHVGWVYAAVHFPTALADLYHLADLHFVLTDQAASARPIFASESDAHAGESALFHRRETLAFGGRDFVLSIASRPELDGLTGGRRLLLFWELGGVISLLMGLAAWLLIGGRQRAVALARHMTQQLDRLAKVGELTMDSVLLADAEGRIAWANPAFYRTHRQCAAEVIGRPLADFCGETMDGDMPARDAWQAALAGQGAFRGETCWTATDGHVHWMETEIQPIHHRDGQFGGVVVIQADITARRLAEEGLKESEAFLDRTGRAAGVGGWQLDLVTQTVTWSAETRRLHEVPDDFQPDFANAVAFYPPRARERIEAAVAHSIATGEGWDLELPFVTFRDKRLWVRAMGLVEFDGDRAVRLTGAFQDITQRKQLEVDLEEQRELLRVTLNSIGDAVVTTDPEARVTWMNPVAERLSGWKADEARGRPITDVLNLVNEETAQPVENPVLIALADNKIVGLAHNSVLLARDGSRYGVEDSAAPIFDTRGTVLGGVMVFHDVTEARAIHREMVHHARHDVLTGLPNRIEFEARASRFLKRVQATGGDGVVMFIDLDHFKVVNDTCGHFAGDDLLRQVSAILVSAVRGYDTVARLGGDEFAVLLENCSAVQAEGIAQAICDAVDHYRFVAPDGQRFRVGTSIGLASMDAAGRSLEHLLQAADSACYAAKAAGRHRYQVWSAGDGDIQSRAGETAWGLEVERALDAQALELYAQRITPRSSDVRASTQGVSCEILVRMKTADGQAISPSAFMQAAERYQLASQIDRWVVTRVFQRLADGVAERFDHVGINLSGQSVSDPAFHEFIKAIMDRARFDLRRICLEITETVAITNLSAASIFLNDMRHRGVRVAMDDFGAGVSSFGYLKSLHVDYLKIDGQFITGLTTSPVDQVSVRSFCELARVLGIRTVAEYVQDEATLRLLDRLGVDFAQGYHLHVPERFDDLLTSLD